MGSLKVEQSTGALFMTKTAMYRLGAIHRTVMNGALMMEKMGKLSQ